MVSRETSSHRNPNIKVFLVMLSLLFVYGTAFAQGDLSITTREIWSTNQELTGSVIVESGGVLEISAGVVVNFHYYDNNPADGKGDYQILVKTGGRLVVNGTVAAPVVFRPLNGVPYTGKDLTHWKGIVFEAQTNPLLAADTLNNISIISAWAGLSYTRTIPTTGLSLTKTALTLGMNNTSIYSITLDSTSLAITGNNVLLRYATITAPPAAGITITGSGAVLDYLDLSGATTGILVSGSTAGVTITNSNIHDNTQSGLFNLGGTVSISNTKFQLNTWNGIVNSSGTLTADQIDVNRNSANGIIAAGSGITTVTNATDTANTSYGFYIAANPMAVDAAAPVAGGTEVPVVRMNTSNIYSNNGTGAEVISNASPAAAFVSDFTANWWGVGTGVENLVTQTVAGSVNYSNWIEAGVGAFFNSHANLSVAKTITFTYPADAQTVLSGEPLTIRWTTTGNIPSVKITTTGATPVVTALVVNNTGSYTYTPTSNAASTVVVTENITSGPVGSGTLNYTSVAASLVVNYPALNNDVYGGPVTITWVAPSSVLTVKILVDPDGVGALAPVTLANPVPNTGSYTVTMPNYYPSAAALITVTSVTGTAYTDNSPVFHIHPAPSVATWGVTRTASYINVHIADVQLWNTDGTSALSGTPAANTDDVYVGAFYLDGTTLKCAGIDTIQAYDDAPVGDVNPATLSVWLDNPYTTAIDGVPANTNLLFKVWRNSWNDLDIENTTNAGDILDRNATPSAVVNSNTLLTNLLTLKYTRSTSGTAATKLQMNLPLTSNWNMISSNIIPDLDGLGWVAAGFTAGGVVLQAYDPALDPASPIDSSTGFSNPGAAILFNILKDGQGNVYWNLDGTNPNLIDQMNDTWDYRKGYYLKMATGIVPATDSLYLFGFPADPTAITSQLSLTAGWNMVPYLRDGSMTAGQALSSIAEYIRIVKDDVGNVYWPAYSIDNIGTLDVGEAYLIYMNAADVLVYPANSAPSPSIAPTENVVKYDIEHYVVERNSDNSAVVAILESAIRGNVEAGDEIGFFNSRNQLVGSTVYNGGNIAAVVWGMETGMKDDLFGMREGEEYSIRIYSRTTGVEKMLTGISLEEGENFYTNNGISVVSGVKDIKSALPTKFDLSQNFPNPFNPTTTINFDLPQASKVSLKVFNVLGEMVTELVNAQFEAGYHTVQFDASILASGIYFYRIEAGNFVSTKKMNLVK